MHRYRYIYNCIIELVDMFLIICGATNISWGLVFWPFFTIMCFAVVFVSLHLQVCFLGIFFCIYSFRTNPTRRQVLLYHIQHSYLFPFFIKQILPITITNAQSYSTNRSSLPLCLNGMRIDDLN